MRTLIATTLGSALVLACGGDSNGPGDFAGTPYVPGQVIAATVPGTDSLAFHFHAPISGSATIYLEGDSPQLEADLYDSTTGEGLGGFAGIQEGLLLEQNYSNRIAVTAGQAVILRVHEPLPRSAKVHVLVDITSDGPESLPDTIALDTVYSGESIATPGDLDRYLFPVIAGHGYAVYLQPTDLPGPSKFLGLVHRRAGVIRIQVDHGPATLTSNISPGFMSDFTGYQALEIEYDHFNGVANPVVPGGYRFEVRAVNPEPESGDSVLVSGDTVTSSLDFPGDIDRFVFPAHVGDVITMVGEIGVAPAGHGFAMVLDAPDGSEISNPTLVSGDTIVTNPYIATQDGNYHVSMVPFDARDTVTYRLLLQLTPAATPRRSRPQPQ